MCVCVFRVVEKWVMFGQLDSNQSFGIHANENALVKRGNVVASSGHSKSSIGSHSLCR